MCLEASMFAIKPYCKCSVEKANFNLHTFKFSIENQTYYKFVDKFENPIYFYFVFCFVFIIFTRYYYKIFACKSR